jgi:uncharacterized protein (TIGR00730 family)
LSSDSARDVTREVAVIGSARLNEDDPPWAVATELGRRLAEAGLTVVTGGYGGLMRATAQAARNAGGQVVGLPMKEWRHLTPGEWNAELRWAADYPMRLGLMLRCEAVVALDGGVGTLSEMALAWAMAQTEEIAPALLLLGARWRRIVQHFRDELVINEDDLRLVHVVDSPQDAVALIHDQEALARPPRSRG